METEAISKQSIRREYLKRRKEMTCEERAGKSRIIIDKLCGLDCYKTSDVILLYCSYQSEVITFPFLEKLLDGKKKMVYVPKVEGEFLRFYPITARNQLQSGYQNIMEPFPVTEPFSKATEQEHKCLLILPGVAFDKRGNRMGYGKGFYDRFLEEYPRMETCALAYECQIAAELPSEKHDVRAKCIITEKEIYFADEIMGMMERN